MILISRRRFSVRHLLFRIAILAVAGAAIRSPAVRAQRPEAEPEVLKTPLGSTEVGALGGVAYRVDIPTDWNHKLVVFYHGYSERGVTFHIAEELGGQQAPMLERHYAVAQSAYSQTGWALPQAYPETEALRRYFTRAYGAPRETYVAGSSMGGLLTMITLELNPKPYLGGLDLCGPVGPTFESFQRRFALRAAFDFYFPDLLSPLVPTPADFEDSAAQHEKILDALRANPNAAAEMRALTGLHTDAGVAAEISYFTFVVGDMQRRAGGNPFDNRNTIYTGTSPTSSATDDALNEGVRRYAADARASGYLVHHYTPSGRLIKPMLALHTVYDPTVPAASLALYDHMVQAAGLSQNLVQQYVPRDGHCNITPEEIGTAFDDLVRWTHNGPRPTPGLLR